MPNSYLLFGLLAAVLYAFAAPCLKLATERGISSLQLTLIANIATAIGFSIFLPWGSGQLTPDIWWPSLVVGGLFFVGQVFTVMALKHGHASIATPALGSKVVIVALLLAYGFDRPVGMHVFVAAGLTTLGILVLAFPSEHFPMRKVVPAVAFSLLAAMTFGLFDVLTQIWSPRLTFGRLLPWALIFSAMFTVPFILSIERRWQRIPRAAYGSLALGVGLLASQSMVLVWAIGYFKDAAGLNVVFGSRGVWSVVIIWLLGHRFSQHERFRSRAVAVRRLIGATLIAAAVAMTFKPF